MSNVQRDLLLADKVAPYQRRVKWFAENLLHRVFGRWPTVTFDPVAAQDDLALAQASRILVEAGVKTPQEVAEHCWDWAPAGLHRLLERARADANSTGSGGWGPDLQSWILEERPPPQSPAGAPRARA